MPLTPVLIVIIGFMAVIFTITAFYLTERAFTRIGELLDARRKTVDTADI